MSATSVLGVIVIARNGDRVEYYQDPQNYGTTFTETTALGEVCISLSRFCSNNTISNYCSLGSISPAWLLVALAVFRQGFSLIHRQHEHRSR